MIQFDFFQAKHPNPELRSIPLIVQTHGPQLVGLVRRFDTKASSEEHRLEFLAKYGANPQCFAKAKGYRIYVVVWRTMKADFNEHKISNWAETQQRILQQMANFYVNDISEGNRRSFADIEGE